MLRDMLNAKRFDWPSPCRDADETHGNRGDLSPAKYKQTGAGHKVYPYLLRKLKIDKPNHVWAMDISVPQQAA